MAINQYPAAAEGEDKNINYVINQGGTYTVNIPAGAWNAETTSTANVVIGSTTISASSPTNRKIFIPSPTTTTIVAPNPQGVIVSWPNAALWTTRTANMGNLNIIGIAYGNGVYIATDQGFTARRSTDGVTWAATGGSPQGSSGYFGIAYGFGIFIWIGTASTNRWAQSTNGVTWTSLNVNTVNYAELGRPRYAIGAGKMLIANNGADTSSGTARVLISTNGTTWQSAVNGGAATFRAMDIVYNTLRDEFMVSNLSVANNYFTQDGFSWQTRSSPYGAGESHACGYVNNQYLLGGSGGRISTSTNGVTWTFVNTPTEFNGGTVNNFLNGDGLTLASNTAGKIAYSPDGTNWSPYVMDPLVGDTSYINQMAFGNNQFAAAMVNGNLSTINKTVYDTIKPVINTTTTYPNPIYLSLEYKGQITTIS